MPELNFDTAIKSFRDALISQGKLGADQAKLFAARYAGPYALWKQRGTADDQSAIDYLIATMIMQASAIGIDAQAATEQFFRSSLDVATGLALGV